jgi:hypothetical protein
MTEKKERPILEKKILEKNRHSQAKAIHDAFEPAYRYLKDIRGVAGLDAARVLANKSIDIMFNGSDFSFSEVYNYISGNLPVALEEKIISEEVEKLLKNNAA